MHYEKYSEIDLGLVTILARTIWITSYVSHRWLDQKMISLMSFMLTASAAANEYIKMVKFMVRAWKIRNRYWRVVLVVITINQNTLYIAPHNIPGQIPNTRSRSSRGRLISLLDCSLFDFSIFSTFLALRKWVSVTRCSGCYPTWTRWLLDDELGHVSFCELNSRDCRWGKRLQVHDCDFSRNCSLNICIRVSYSPHVHSLSTCFFMPLKKKKVKKRRTIFLRIDGRHNAMDNFL